MDAVLAVDDRHPWRGLRMGQVDRRPALQVLGIAGLMQLGPPGTDRRQVDRAGRADEDAGPAGLALIARLLEGRADAALAAAAEHADRAAGHQVVAGPHAQPAEDALAFGGLFQRTCCSRRVPRPTGPAPATAGPRPGAVPAPCGATPARPPCRSARPGPLPPDSCTRRPAAVPGACRFRRGRRGTRRRATGRGSGRAWGSRCPSAAPRRESSRRPRRSSHARRS